MSPITEQTALPAPEPTAGTLPEHASPSSAGLGGDDYQRPEPSSTPQPRSWTRLVVVFLILAAAVAFVVYRIHTNNGNAHQEAARAEAMANRPVPVAYDVVQRRSIPVYLNALGTVTPYNTVTVKSRVDGEITAIRFREGQRVKQGELLMQIDPRPYQAALVQAQGNLARDQANAANADAEAKRYAALYAAGVVSKEVAQQQESTAGQATGSLEADRAAVESARVNLAYTRITSPISGIVGLRQVDIGNIISANSSTPLIVITQVEPITVIFTLPEDQLPQVFERMRAGRTLTVEAWDRSDSTRLSTGTLLTVDNQIDTTTGTAKLKAVFNNQDGALFPNQFVNVRLILENRTDAITIPAAAVETGSHGSFVYLVDTAHPVSPEQTQSAANAGNRHGGATPSAGGNSAAAADDAGTSGTKHGAAPGGGVNMHQTSYPVHVQNIAVDLTQGSTVVVRSGVQPGQWVVTDGQEKLTEKSKVIPRKAAIAAGQVANTDSASAGNTNSVSGVQNARPNSESDEMYSPGPATDSVHRQPSGSRSGAGQPAEQR